MALSEQQIFQALTTLTHAMADLTHAMADDKLALGSQPERQVDVVRDENPVLATMDSEALEVLGEATLAVAFGAFASRDGFDGPMHTMVAALGLMAMLAGQELDPPAEIMSVVADGERVEAEIDRAG